MAKVVAVGIPLPVETLLLAGELAIAPAAVRLAVYETIFRLWIAGLAPLPAADDARAWRELARLSPAAWRTHGAAVARIVAGLQGELAKQFDAWERKQEFFRRRGKRGGLIAQHNRRLRLAAMAANSPEMPMPAAAPTRAPRYQGDGSAPLRPAELVEKGKAEGEARFSDTPGRL